jgi:hypothetical protein
MEFCLIPCGPLLYRAACCNKVLDAVHAASREVSENLTLPSQR